MSKSLWWFFALLAGNSLYGMQAPVSQKGRQLGTYKPYRIYKGETIGWLYNSKAKDSVLINLGKNRRIKANDPIYTTTHFKYIAPAAPLTALPKGLFLWWSENNKPWLGSKARPGKTWSTADLNVFRAHKGKRVENPYFQYDKNKQRWEWPDTGHSLEEYLKKTHQKLVEHPF